MAEPTAARTSGPLEPYFEPAAPARSLTSPHRRARRHRRRRSRFLARLAGALIVLLLASAAGVSYLAYGQARQVENQVIGEFTAAQADLQQAKQTLANASSGQADQAILQTRALTGSARSHFIKGRQVADSSSLLRNAQRLPYGSSYVKSRVAAIDALAAMGVALSYTVDDAADVDEQLLKPAGDSSGSKILSALQAIQPRLDKLNADLSAAKVAVEKVDASVLPQAQQASLAAARTTIEKGLTAIQSLKQLIPVVFEIMGGNGPRTYLIEQLNPAELRGGGGFFGSYAVVQASAGNLKQTKSGAIETVDYNSQHQRPQKGQAAYVAPPSAMLEFIGTNSWTLEDSNFFPDFPTNAKWAEFFSDKEMKIKPDGVFALDPIAVGYLLGVTGPIAIPGYGITVEGSSFANFVFDYENGPGAPASRKALLGAVAEQLINRLSALPPTSWPGLLTALNRAAQEHHLQLEFNNQQAEDQMAKFGWAQSLNPVAAPDFAMDVESNFGGTKANHFLSRRFDVTLTRDGNTVHHKVVMQLDENLNAPVVPDYPQIYRAYCRFFIPADASHATVAGVKTPDRKSDEQTPGLQMLDGWIQITPQGKTGSYSVTYQYDTPWKPDAQGSEQLFWQKQAGTNADQLSVTFVSGGRTLKAAGTLSTDQIVRFGDSGLTVTANQAAGASLPSISL